MFALGRQSSAAVRGAGDGAAGGDAATSCGRQPVVAPEPSRRPDGPTILQRLSGFLSPEIAAGKVSVLGTDNATGGADQQHRAVRQRRRGGGGQGDIPLLRKIGAALWGSETGTVTVTGYTDDQPIHTLQFPVQLRAFDGAGASGGGDHGPDHRR